MLAQPDRDSIEVADDLITVCKELKDVGRAGVAGIEIRVDTDSPVPVAFRLVEQFAEGVSMDDVAVHPQFSPEKWTTSEPERRMVFEDVVAPGEEVVTLYGVLEGKYDSLDPFLGEPEIDITQQVDPGTKNDGSERLFRGGAVAAGTADSPSAEAAIDLEKLLETASTLDDDDVLETAAALEPDADLKQLLEQASRLDGDDDSPPEPTAERPENTDPDSEQPADLTLTIHTDPDSANGATDSDLQAIEAPGATESDFEPVAENEQSADAGPANEPPTADGTFVFDRSDAQAGEPDEAVIGELDVPAAESPAASPVELDGEDAEGTAASAAEPTPGPTSAGGAVDLGNASVVTAFIDELEHEELSDEQLTALRDALDLEPAESVRLRVSHLQSEVADLSAYTEEFERFVDEEGSVSGVLDEFRAELDRVDEHVDDLSVDARAAAEERVALQDDVDRLERELASLRENHESDVGQLSTRLDDVETGSVAADEVTAIREALEAERAWRRKVVGSIEALAENTVDRDLEW